MATTSVQMLAARQPFAPLNGSRLQTLTSLKNRQNAVTSSIKRKATAMYDDDTENVDPILFTSPKRSKAQDGTAKDAINFSFVRGAPSARDLTSLKTTSASPNQRPILPARSPVPRINAAAPKPAKTTPLPAPAGRSPPRKRIGILNCKKIHCRVDPPKFATRAGSGLGFSIDAALSGSISSRGRPNRASTPPVARRENARFIRSLHTAAKTRSAWSFQIHEDTPDELATNLLEHSTCTLDISSDEESAIRLRNDRGKENVAPADDISQTTTPLTASADKSDQKSATKSRRSRTTRRKTAAGEIEIDRAPLRDLAAEDFYAKGCHAKSVFIIAPDGTTTDSDSFEAEIELEGEGEGLQPDLTVEALMAKDVEPIEKAEEGFEIWASGSAQGDDELL